MGLSNLALFGAVQAFGFAYVSTLRGSARQSSAMRVALTLPLCVVSLVAVVQPLSVFSLSAVGLKSGVVVSGVSLYPHGSDAIADLTLRFSVSEPLYWAWGALILSILALVSAWRTYRRTVRSGQASSVLSGSAMGAWGVLWCVFLYQLPISFGAIDGGEVGIKSFLSISSQVTPVEAYLIPRESWVYVPDQWYLVLIALGSVLLSLFSLLFKSSTSPSPSPSPVWPAIGVLLILVAIGASLEEAHLARQSSLWVSIMLLCAVSFSRIPPLQRNVVLVSSLMVLVGMY